MTKLLPCKQCGSTDIELWDCGYSSFNPGGGKCKNGHKVSGEAGCMPKPNDLAKIWNAGQKPTATEELQAENKRLRATLRSLYNELIARPASSRSKRCQSAVDAAAAELFEPGGKVKE